MPLPPQVLHREKMDRLDATQVAEVSRLVNDERLNVQKKKQGIESRQAQQNNNLSVDK